MIYEVDQVKQWIFLVLYLDYLHLEENISLVGKIIDRHTKIKKPKVHSIIKNIFDRKRM